MNSITFPTPLPTLKLARNSEKWAATLAEERRRLLEDHEALREREANLREYEERLRAWQAELDAGRVAVTARQTTPTPFQRPSSRTPFTDDPVLPGAWEKLHRARELLEAEQSHLRNDRIHTRDLQEALKRREAELAEREAEIAEREALVAAAVNGNHELSSAAVDQPMSTMSKITRGPFDMARSVFGGKK